MNADFSKPQTDRMFTPVTFGSVTSRNRIVMEGECDFTVNGETQRVDSGGVVIIPAHAVHSSKPLKECRVLDVFHPLREDYR